MVMLLLQRIDKASMEIRTVLIVRDRVAPRGLDMSSKRMNAGRAGRADEHYHPRRISAGGKGLKNPKGDVHIPLRLSETDPDYLPSQFV